MGVVDSGSPLGVVGWRTLSLLHWVVGVAPLQSLPGCPSVPTGWTVDYYSRR